MKKRPSQARNGTWLAARAGSLAHAYRPSLSGGSMYSVCGNAGAKRHQLTPDEAGRGRRCRSCERIVLLALEAEVSARLAELDTPTAGVSPLLEAITGKVVAALTEQKRLLGEMRIAMGGR